MLRPLCSALKTLSGRAASGRRDFSPAVGRREEKGRMRRNPPAKPRETGFRLVSYAPSTFPLPSNGDNRIRPVDGNRWFPAAFCSRATGTQKPSSVWADGQTGKESKSLSPGGRRASLGIFSQRRESVGGSPAAHEVNAHELRTVWNGCCQTNLHNWPRLYRTLPVEPYGISGARAKN